MLAYSFNLIEESQIIEKAVEKTLDEGYRTSDIYSQNTQLVSTQEFTKKIINNL